MQPHILKRIACKLMAYLFRKARWNLRFTVLTLSDLVCTVTNLNHNQFLLHQHGSHLLILKLHNLSETCFIFFALTTGQIRKTSASNNFTVNHSFTKRIYARFCSRLTIRKRFQLLLDNVIRKSIEDYHCR